MANRRFKRRNAYDAAFKLKAVDLAVKEGNRAAAHTLDINESMVRRWRCQREELAQCKKAKKAFRGNKSRWPELEDSLGDWLNTQRADGRGVSTEQIRLKAKTVATEMNIEDFKGGPSWCLRFMKRKGLSITTSDQCVESRLQVKMNSPDSSRDISVKQEEPEDHPHLDVLHVVVCKEEVSPKQESSPSLLQEEPEPPHIKKEEEELLQTPEEPAGSRLALLAVKKSEDGDEDVPSHCFEVKVESDTEVKEDSDDWDETSGGQSASNTSSTIITRKRQGDTEEPSRTLTQSGETCTDALNITGEKQICKHCDESFNSELLLTIHQRTHAVPTPGRPHRCTTCDKCFNQSRSLKQHLLIHSEEKSFHCEHCDKSFNTPGKLLTHTRTHTGGKPFSCTVCNKSFAASGYLKVHQRVHTGERPFHCQHCDKSFKDSYNLKKHQLVHAGEKLYRCTHCDKSLRVLGNLKTHTFHCKHCDKSFSLIV